MKEEIEKHYSRPEVKGIILNWCNIDEPKKAQRSLVASHRGWYQYRENKDGEAPQEKALVPATEEGYDKQIKRMERQGERSLYHSLNYFDPSVFREWVDHWPNDEDKEEESPGSYKETVFYGLGTDIDLKDQEKVEGLDRDRTVTKAEDREWLERAIKFHIDWLTNHGISGNIIKPYFSGNGAYITLDPSVIFLDCQPQEAEEICRAYNYVIKQIEKEFFEENPEAKDYVQFDALNNSKRQWKTPLSIHKSKPFACIPFMMEHDHIFGDPVIDLEKAKLPLSDTVIAQAEQRVHDRPSVDEREKYTKQVGELLQKPILKDGDRYKTPKKAAKEEIYEKAQISLAREPLNISLDLEDKEAIPPCIEKLLEADEALSHARGKALLALFFNKIGLDPEEAKEKWTELCNKAGGPKTNIFESFYNEDLNLPKCETVQKSGSSFPSMTFGDMGLCDPNETCEKIRNLAQYIKKNTGAKIEAELIPSQVNANLVGKRVKLRGRVVREKSKKALPKEAVIRCQRCGESAKFDINDTLVKKKLVFKGRKRINNILETVGKPMLPSDCKAAERGGHSTFAKPIANIDYSIVWIKDNLEDMDEARGDHDIELKVAVLGHQLPNSRKIEVEGELAVHPVSTDLVLLADEIKPLELVPEELELSDKMLHYFTKVFGTTVSKDEINDEIDGLSDKKLHYVTNGLGDTVDLREQVAPDMVGRDIVRESRLLTLHSPIIIPDIDESKLLRGSLRELLFGDTKTYKSESVKDLTEDKYQLGEYAVAETGSRAGLAYSIDTDNKALTWGTLPLNDRGYVGIDGLNRLHSEEMAEFREILASQKVIVRKFVSGDANARVRISACMNPPEPMNQYLTPCEALNDTYIFKKTPDITRWDIFIPFNDSDVSKRDITNRTTKERPIPDDLFKNHVLWAWSRGPEDIEYTKEATEEIKNKAPDLIEKYGFSELPVVHNGIRDVLTRLSVAFGCLKHSTEDHVTVTVKEEHVEYAINFYEEMLKELGILEYKEMIEEDLSLSHKDFVEITQEIDKKHVDILDQIKLGPMSSKELAEKLDTSPRTVKRRYDLLKDYDLVETKTGKGVKLTKKGVQFVRKLLGFELPNSNSQTISDIVKETFTNRWEGFKENFYRDFQDFDGETAQAFINEEASRYDISEDDAWDCWEQVKEEHEGVGFEQGTVEDLEEGDSD